jgi:hypothetical protein
MGKKSNDENVLVSGNFCSEINDEGVSFKTKTNFERATLIFT